MEPTYIDLTQTLEPGIPDWDGCCGFQMQETFYEEQGIRVQSLTTPAGIGTYMDAPSHFIKGASDIASIPTEKLIAPAVILDLRKQAHAKYFIQVVPEFARETISEQRAINGNGVYDKDSLLFKELMLSRAINS
jgi:kynurenine formamidase